MGNVPKNIRLPLVLPDTSFISDVVQRLE